MFLINSIYLATEGEGVHLGTPQIFIRYQGCHIGCINCDSKDTWEFSSETELTLPEILLEVEALGKNKVKRVSITGGDPLHPKFESGLIELIKALKEKSYYINIEAAGVRVVDSVFDLADFVSFDIKTPSTGIETPKKNVLRMIEQYKNKVQFKSVVADKKDFYYCENFYDYLESENDLIAHIPWCLTPEINPQESFRRENFVDVLQWGRESKNPFRVIGQQHKWIFGAEAKQV